MAEKNRLQWGGVPRGQWQIPNNFDPSTPPKSDRARMPVNLITRISDKSEIEFLNQVHRGDRRDSRFLL